LCGCEKWFIPIREEHRLRVSENRVLRIIFGPKREELAGGWRKAHSEEFHKVYISPSIIRVIKSRRMRWLGHVTCMGEMKNGCRIVRNPGRKRPLGRARHRWKNNIRMDLQK
jgi:hypothetical protein